MLETDRKGNTMQTLDSYVAAAQTADRHVAARTARTARRARRAAGTDGLRLVLRRAAAEDAPALARLARLDSSPRLRGEVLVAEVEGQIVAAVPFDGGPAIADPFRPTSDIVEILRTRAELVAPRAPQRRLPRLRLPRVRVA